MDTIEKKIDVLVCPADENLGGLSISTAMEFLKKFQIVVIECRNHFGVGSRRYLVQILVKNENGQISQEVKRILDKVGIPFNKDVRLHRPEVNAFVVYEDYPEVAQTFTQSGLANCFFIFPNAYTAIPQLRSKDGAFVLYEDSPALNG